MHTQRPRFGTPQAAPNPRAREAHEATAQGRAAQSARPLTLNDLHTLVVSLNSRMLEQEKKITVLEDKITVLQQENSDLWQEIHRLKGPRFPLEIFFSIVNSARDDKKALKTFSLTNFPATDLHSGVIKSLSPHILPTEYPVTFRDFSHHFGGSLSDIKLSISGKDGAVEFIDSQYFATLSQLKYIVLDLWEFKLLLPWLPKIITQLPSSMEEITLDLIDFESPDQLSLHKSAAIWSQLDRILLGAKLPSLRSLTIVCNRLREEEETLMKAMGPQLLPCFAKKRILAIKFK
ncbi:hypothetical protein GGX14DRAFT_392285 [Mycena pura]|uniref:Uncharacterized protein n=1 Tax=Mycena pura TaxID=153505 RepID=A0AAD6VJQ7_9AGAR|nr:hypothetical protein GGX14DRAFT_392285 [Mycena pura]